MVYRDVDMLIKSRDKSYEMIIPEPKQVNGFNAKGVLLLKNIIENIEYCLYDNSVPVNYNITDELESYYNNGCKIYLHIKAETGIIDEVGKLEKEVLKGLNIYYINDIDLHDFLFDHTNEMVHIKIKRRDKTNNVAINKGEDKKNGTRKYEENNKS